METNSKRDRVKNKAQERWNKMKYTFGDSRRMNSHTLNVHTQAHNGTAHKHLYHSLLYAERYWRTDIPSVKYQINVCTKEYGVRPLFLFLDTLTNYFHNSFTWMAYNLQKCYAHWQNASSRLSRQVWVVACLISFYFFFVLFFLISHRTNVSRYARCSFRFVFGFCQSSHCRVYISFLFDW